MMQMDSVPPYKRSSVFPHSLSPSYHLIHSQSHHFYIQIIIHNFIEISALVACWIKT
jgi:hypothetical protein